MPWRSIAHAPRAIKPVARLGITEAHAIDASKLKNDLGWVPSVTFEQGLDRTAFTDTYRSFGVTSKARKAAQLQDAYQVDGVPSIGIAGRYFTSGSLAQTLDRSLQVADHLIEQARKG